MMALHGARLSRDAWIRRLLERRVDATVLLAPHPPESAWVRDLPALFRSIAVSPDGGNAAFGFDAVAAESLLARRMMRGT